MGRINPSGLNQSHKHLQPAKQAPPDNHPMRNQELKQDLAKTCISRLSAANLLKKVVTIVAGTLVCSAIAANVNDMPAQAQVPPLADYPLLTIGSTGETVSQLQATLQLLGFYQGPIDGTYSEPTAKAVAQFQSAAGILADGITGSATWQKLLPAPEDESVTMAAPPAPTPVAPPIATTTPENSAEPVGPPVLMAESSGSAVAQLQRELQTLGYYDGVIDGNFGAQTLVAVKKFQTDRQLLVDGIVGQSTWDALSRALEM